MKLWSSIGAAMAAALMAGMHGFAPPAAAQTPQAAEAPGLDAFMRHRDAADRGDAEAMFQIAEYYRRGLGGMAQNHVEAVRWYRRAAEQGHPEAIFGTGMYHQTGEGGLAQDRAEALRWFRHAAERGHLQANFLVGLYHYGGEGGLERDHAEALRWFRRAAEGGLADALRAVANYYEQGLGGLTRDLDEALRWYQRAADAGDTDVAQSISRVRQALGNPAASTQPVPPQSPNAVASVGSPPRLDHAYLSGRWNQNTDCGQWIDFTTDGRYATYEGARGPWVLDGDRLTLQGDVTIVIRIAPIDTNTMTVINADGSSERSNRC